MKRIHSKFLIYGTSMVRFLGPTIKGTARYIASELLVSGSTVEYIDGKEISGCDSSLIKKTRMSMMRTLLGCVHDAFIWSFVW